MNDRLPVIDADGHVTEPFAIWTDYMEPAFRSRASARGVRRARAPVRAARRADR